MSPSLPGLRYMDIIRLCPFKGEHPLKEISVSGKYHHGRLKGQETHWVIASPPQKEKSAGRGQVPIPALRCQDHFTPG